MEATIGQAVAVLRDVCFVLAILLGVFKLGLWMKPAIDFFKESKKFMALTQVFMTNMDSNVDKLLTNHLSHIDDKLEKIIEITVQANKDRRNIGE